MGRMPRLDPTHARVRLVLTGIGQQFHTGGGRQRGKMTNHLYYGDNLAVLRDSIKDASVDLIYLDPPFNSNASYNVLFKGAGGDGSAAQIEAFDDTWHWNDSALLNVTCFQRPSNYVG